MPNVTVIVPAFNAESCIRQCADSILNQTLSDIEIIFIDDGSTDQTGTILDDMTKDYTNARVIHQSNKGLYKTREIGLSLATGDYIGWVDADDYVEKDMFEILYKIAIKKNSELVICDYSWFPEKIATKEKWYREYRGVVDTTFIERNSQPWNKIVKRELMIKLNIGENFTTCFDEIYILILMKAKHPVTVNKALYNYRVGGKTMSSSYKNIAHYQRFVVASINLRQIMKSFVNDAYWCDYFDYRVSYYLLMTMIVAANARDKTAYERNRKEMLSQVPAFNKNQHFWKILRENYGFFKSMIIGNIIPVNYYIACIICKIGIK